MKLTNEDIAFIAEMRSEHIRWEYLARTFGICESTLRRKWKRAMDRGYL